MPDRDRQCCLLPLPKALPRRNRGPQEKSEATRPRERRKGIQANSRKPFKRQRSTDDEDDDAASPKDPKKPIFMVLKATGEDANAAFGHGVERSGAAYTHILALMAMRTHPIRDAWIVDSSATQDVCNDTSKFFQMGMYHGPALRSVDATTSLSG
ncbi:unnamed protein product [Clonostachys rhizophaga]|uniref:Uncharacterized protein n=1 Tax=Clonostachys rhizophaga TaxID=160324 RepID=A0A9N9UW22_9HYPO|nr:unnamed protein product [Clonostachys rhizophaga]